MNGYLPQASGIFSGGAGGVLGDGDSFLEAAGGMGALQEAAGGLASGLQAHAAFDARRRQLVAQGVPAEQAAAQASAEVPQTPVAKAGLLDSLGPVLPLAAAGAAYYFLPEKYKTLGSIAAGAAVYFATQKKGA